MAVLSLLQPWLVSGLAYGCVGRQVLLPASARLNAQLSQQQNACFQAVQTHLSFSTCAGIRHQDDSSCSSSSKGQPGPCIPAAASTLMAHLQTSPTSAAFFSCMGAQRRGVSTTAAAAAAGTANKQPFKQPTQQERMLMEQDFKMNVLGRVMEQYRHPVGYFESGAYRSFSRTKAFIWDWGVRWLRARQGKSAAATNIPGYTDAAFLEEVARIYLEVQGAQAVMQADLARDVISKQMYLKLKSQADQRARQWTSIQWECVDAEDLHKNVTIVQRKCFKFWPESPFDWLQFTCCIRSKQRFAAYGVDAQGQPVLLSGDPNKALDVTEYCVFERKTRAKVKRSASSMLSVGVETESTHLEGSRWRLVGWINPDAEEGEEEED